MPDGPPATRPIVVCPLEFERQQLEKAGLGAHCDLQCCGPGGDRVAGWAGELPHGARTVILAGLAGSLRTDRPAGSAWLVTSVARPGPRSAYTPTLSAAALATEPTEILSTDITVGRAIARRQLQLASGATLVDLESERFAAIATDRHWMWAIVRGVSDDFSTIVPDDIDRWVQPDGRTSYSIVMRSLLCRPTLMPIMMELRRNSTAAMEQVGRVINSLVGQPA